MFKCTLTLMNRLVATCHKIFSQKSVAKDIYILFNFLSVIMTIPFMRLMFVSFLQWTDWTILKLSLVQIANLCKCGNPQWDAVPVPQLWKPGASKGAL